ncbi:MAG: MGH1-like glycoside hydrolase domain-containing protein, partial [Promethearchaeota archaeon]
MGQRDIIASVKGLMEANWCEGEIRDRDYSGSKNKITPEKAERFFYTCPDRNIYPHQWFWDSCFHIIINSKLSELNRALKELSTLLANQSEIGHIGHMNYWMSKGISPIDYILKRYYPDKDRTPLIQPAFLAHAFKYLLNAIKILKKNNKGTKNSKVIDEFDESDIFKEYYPKILKYYLYILNTRAYSLDFIKTILLKTPQKELERQDPINLRLEVREKLKNFESLRVEDSEDRQDLFRRIMKDLGDEFIIFNIHPWESGTDNIPIYDKLLKIKPPFLIIKWMIKMLRSLSFNKKDKWVVPAIIKRNYFVIGDVLNNSVFADGLTILSKLAAEYNQASDSEWLRKVAQIHVASIYKRMYSDEDKIFYSIDIFGNFIKVKAVSSFAPLNLDFVNNPIIKEINKG